MTAILFALLILAASWVAPHADLVAVTEDPCARASDDFGRAVCEISVAFGPNTGAAYRVAMCETGQTLDARAEGADLERGLMQLHPIHRERIETMGYTWGQMYEVQANLRVAKAIYDEQGWQPWSCVP